MDRIIDYLNSNRDRHLEELIEFVRIPSVSADSAHKANVERCAHWVADQFKKIGLENVDLHKTGGHPVVYGDWLNAGKDAPTVLVYGHYDVQPVDPISLWEFPPFEPTIKDGKLHGRGASDDKGQVYTHIKAVEAHLKTNGTLPVNVKFIIEGEEECGSSNLEEYIKKNCDKLACDVVLISDTDMYQKDLPALCYALRGITYLELTVKGPDKDLHSGTYGGAIDNPLNVLCDMMSRMRDKYGKITVPGFYDDVLEVDHEEHLMFEELPFDEDQYKAEVGAKALNGEFGYTTLERTWARPSMDLNGIYGGYTGEGSKTILPSYAKAKLSFRLVPNQDSKDVTAKIVRYIKSIAPPTVTVEIDFSHSGEPVLIPKDSPAMQAAAKALKLSFSKDPVFMREGGSIPIVQLFKLALKAPTVLMGFGLATDNIHSPNEHYVLDNFFGGIKASSYFFSEYAKIMHE